MGTHINERNNTAFRKLYLVLVCAGVVLFGTGLILLLLRLNMSAEEINTDFLKVGLYIISAVFMICGCTMITFGLTGHRRHTPKKDTNLPKPEDENLTEI